MKSYHERLPEIMILDLHIRDIVSALIGYKEQLLIIVLHFAPAVSTLPVPPSINLLTPPSECSSPEWPSVWMMEDQTAMSSPRSQKKALT